MCMTFHTMRLSRAVPYGVYDVGSNCGSVYVGTSADTLEFAVTSLARWWEDEGRQRFPHATQLLILADAGGSNGCRTRSGYRSTCKSSSAIAMGESRDSVPLSHGVFEMESHRASAL
jgi:hypothetical protein